MQRIIKTENATIVKSKKVWTKVHTFLLALVINLEQESRLSASKSVRSAYLLAIMPFPQGVNGAVHHYKVSTITKKHTDTSVCFFVGAGNQNRTDDLVITNDVLYRLSHTSDFVIIPNTHHFVKMIFKLSLFNFEKIIFLLTFFVFGVIIYK